MKFALRPRRSICVTALLLAFLSPLEGHDFWLASAPWNTQPGATITLTANVGDDTFPVSDSFTESDRVEAVRVVGPGAGAITPISRKQRESLATDINLPSSPATYVIVMSVKGRFLSMPADKFAEYLKEEGLNDVLAERTRRGEAGQPSRERYFRQAKVLVHAGDGTMDHVTKPTGLVAELVPESDFTRGHVGDTVSVRLLYRGSPVNAAQIALTSSSAPKATRSTDKEGRAQFKLLGKGPYLLSTVVMVRRENETGPQAVDWESYWCSLTFDVADGVPVGR